MCVYICTGGVIGSWYDTNLNGVVLRRKISVHTLVPENTQQKHESRGVVIIIVDLLLGTFFLYLKASLVVYFFTSSY